MKEVKKQTYLASGLTNQVGVGIATQQFSIDLGVQKFKIKRITFDYIMSDGTYALFPWASSTNYTCYLSINETNGAPMTAVFNSSSPTIAVTGYKWRLYTPGVEYNYENVVCNSGKLTINVVVQSAAAVEVDVNWCFSVDIEYLDDND